MSAGALVVQKWLKKIISINPNKRDSDDRGSTVFLVYLIISHSYEKICMIQYVILLISLRGENWYELCCMGAHWILYIRKLKTKGCFIHLNPNFSANTRIMHAEATRMRHHIMKTFLRKYNKHSISWLGVQRRTLELLRKLLNYSHVHIFRRDQKAFQPRHVAWNSWRENGKKCTRECLTHNWWSSTYASLLYFGKIRNIFR